MKLFKTNSCVMITKSAVVQVALLFLIPLATVARTFPVNSIEDINDLTPGNGLCVAYLIVNPPFVLPFCTLRAAIEEANAYPGIDVIELPAGVFNLTLTGVGKDTTTTGDLDITDSLTITGKGAERTFIDGKELDRIFHIIGSGTTVTLKKITLINGKISDQTPGYPKGGGAIRNEGTLHLENVVLLDHQTTGGGSSDLGGILYNSGTCHVVHSTLQGGKAYEGGAFYNEYGAKMTILSSTISTNDAVIGAGGANYGVLEIKNSTFSTNGSSQTVFGGGLENRHYVSILHATFAFNRAIHGGGISNRSPLYLHNTILGNNTGGDCYEPHYLYSIGSNLDSDGSCILTEASDITGRDPGFQTLKNNGGNTMTHTLLPLSPGRDAGTFTAELPYDQRGKRRPQGSSVDIGAVENSPFALPPLIFPIIP